MLALVSSAPRRCCGSYLRSLSYVCLCALLRGSSRGGGHISCGWVVAVYILVCAGFDLGAPAWGVAVGKPCAERAATAHTAMLQRIVVARVRDPAVCDDYECEHVAAVYFAQSDVNGCCS